MSDLSTAATSADGGTHATFRRLLLNTLVSGVTSSFVWFALTFWVYLETRSVVATGVIGGAFGLASAAIGPAFGTYVDHHRKKAAMVLATAASTVCFAAATSLFLIVDADRLLEMRGPWFWAPGGVDAAGVGGRPDARHRDVHLRDPARARARSGPGERHGRHRHRRVVRHHVGLQRARHRPARDGVGALRLARPDGRRLRAPPGDHDRRARARPRSRPSGPPRGHPRRHRRDPLGPRALDADLPGRLQQPPRRACSWPCSTPTG